MRRSKSAVGDRFSCSLWQSPARSLEQEFRHCRRDRTFVSKPAPGARPYPLAPIGTLTFKWRASRPTRKIGGRPTGFRRAPLVSRQPACKPGSVWHASRARIRDGHSSGTPVARRLKQPTRTAGSGHRSRSLAFAKPRAAPIRSCSRWGLPCRRRCRRRGALLPHRFTLTVPARRPNGGLFSVALSLDLHPPDVIRHRLSTEPGLSSPATFRFRRSGRPAD
jgi:hypothetical protein